MSRIAAAGLSLCCVFLMLNLTSSADDGRSREDRAIENALDKITAQCPREYPEVVKPVPEPGGLADRTDAQLLEMLDVWNPALRVGVAAEIGRRGKSVVPELVDALSSKVPERRAGALSAFRAMIGHQAANWQEFRPEAVEQKAAEAEIRQEFADLLLEKVLVCVGDKELSVRSGALGVINALSIQNSKITKAVLRLCVDTNEYLADQASAVLGKADLTEVEPEMLMSVFRKALKNPLPRGKGSIVQLIVQADESLQRELIPDLLAHLDLQPDRDTMFGASGQAEALNLLTRLRVKELIPRLPGLMDKTMRGPGLFDHCVESIAAFGPDAVGILPAMKERIARKEALLSGSKLSGAHAETLQKRLDALRKAVANVEK